MWGSSLGQASSWWTSGGPRGGGGTAGEGTAGEEGRFLVVSLNSDMKPRLVGFKRPPSVPAELGHPGGGRADPGHPVGAAEARPGGGGIRGGEGRRQVEADLRQRLEPAGRQGRLRHVRLPRREELQRPGLQVSPGGGAWGGASGRRGFHTATDASV